MCSKRILSFTFLLLTTYCARAGVLPQLEPIRYSLQDTYIGRDFFKGWLWETVNDPTHGRVNYVGQADAINANLSFASDEKFVMRADAQKVVLPGSRGRDSIRISSIASYDESLIVLDLSHMPEGCATWPAFWTLSQAGPWPKGGEIDIIEGVNLVENNLSSLHTLPNCTQCDDRYQTGYTQTTVCDTNVDYNKGCGVSFARRESYGSYFNFNGGGYYVMQRSRSNGVNIWFKTRWEVPWEIKDGEDNITIDLFFGPPDAHFDFGDTCNYDAHFDAHKMVFDLTLCGDWAGSVFPSALCGNVDCVTFVDNYPEAFENAYWEINSLRVYTPLSSDNW
ncbi:hypothetical protein AX15_007765 [Amanita polypyramis BW_CC]|nr:hypothetical protein AX15_007765 [Amanita polypyramis BW_CC]